MNTMLTALQITLLGMGLVFAAILLLWGMMSLLTFITAGKTRAVEDVSRPTEGEAVAEPENRARAAAVVVAIALAELQTSSARPLQDPPTAIVSAWQLGMRTRQMYQKGLPLRRQPREGHNA